MTTFRINSIQALLDFANLDQSTTDNILIKNNLQGCYPVQQDADGKLELNSSPISQGVAKINEFRGWLDDSQVGKTELSDRMMNDLWELMIQELEREKPQ